MRGDLYGRDGVVELVAAMHGLGLLPGAGVRVEGVAEVLLAAVGVGVGRGGRAQQGEAEDAAFVVVAVLGVVEDGEASCLASPRSAQLQRGDFELGLLPGVVAKRGALDGAEGDLVGGLVALCGEGKAALRRTWVSCQSTSLPTCGRCRRRRRGRCRWVNFEDCQVTLDCGSVERRAPSVRVTESTLVDRGVMWPSSVPGSMFQASYLLRGVFEGLELVAAGLLGARRSRWPDARRSTRLVMQPVFLLTETRVCTMPFVERDECVGLVRRSFG